MTASPASRAPASGRSAARLLAFDAAGASCSAAVMVGGRLAAHRFEAMRRGQAERLVPMIDAVLAEAGLAYGALDALAVTTGPGGFTGVRLGLATARGLALALERPLIGVSSFEALAAGVPEAARVGKLCLVAIEAKRADVYVQAFDGAGAALSEPSARLPEALPEWLDELGQSEGGPAGRALLVAGDAAERAAAALKGAGIPEVAARPQDCDARVVARLALERPWPAPGEAGPRPLYLRPADAKPMAPSPFAAKAAP